MEFTSVFDDAGRDAEAETHLKAVTSAQVEAQTCWPFLALARSETEFGHRLALSEDRLAAIAALHGVSYEEVTAQFQTAFAALHPKESTSRDVLEAIRDRDPDSQTSQPSEADYESHEKWAKATYGDEAWDDYHANWDTSKEAASAVSCKNCGHANPPHRKGGLCSCGCESYQPGTRTAAKDGHDFKDNSWGSTCTKCGMDKPEPGEYAPSCDTVNEGFGFKDHGPRGPYNDEPYREAAKTAAGATSPDPVEKNYGPDRGSHYAPDSIDSLPLGGTKSNPVHYYNEGYDHGQAGKEYKGYGGRDMAILYGHGYRHGKQDKTSAKESSLHTLSARDAFDARLELIMLALAEGQDPLEWLSGDAGGAAQSHHDSTQQFEGDTPVALDSALSQGGGSGAPESPGGHSDTQQKEGSRPF